MDHVAHDNIICLEQGIALLQQLTDEAYTLPNPDCFSSTVGGHMRHNTDHYEQFLTGWQQGEVDYDSRGRDKRVETERAHAVEVMRSIASGLAAIPADSLDLPVCVKMDTGGSEEVPWSSSTVRRELQFLLSHTIHHYALIATICHLQKIPTPDDFGVAPSTLRYQRSQA